MKKSASVVAILLMVLSAHSEIFSFYSITSNDPSGFSQSVGQDQLFMDVNIMSPGLVSIVFTNTGPQASIVKEIYFDSPDLQPPVNLDVYSIINGSGVTFVEDATPPNLPGGQSPLIAFYSDEDVQASNPAPQKGINPGETLELRLTYTDPPHDFIDMLHASEMRVGLHVGGMGTGDYSESFINVIPEPTSAILLGAAATATVFVRRKFGI